ncbi:hypothetical protein JCM10908_000976 [Rhodotorula pacifica]|uniref:uncharacterized protein n=1 Tax=Rhodotorula pacifica TaxID=1495444 RepID=UPI00316B532E
MSRAILSDAAALVRGDRFFTLEATAGSVTSFHYGDLQPDYENGAFGGQIGKLLMHHFPKAYTYNSVYALFRFTTPRFNKQNLTEFGIAHKYDFRAPAKWMTHKDDFRLPDCLSLSTSSPKSSESFSKVVDPAFYPPQWAVLMHADLAKLVQKQLAGAAWLSESDENSCMVDIVADAKTPVVTSFMADQFGIPLKSKENLLGLWTAQQLYEALTECWTFAYRNFDPALGFKLRDKAMKASEVLMTVIETRLLQTAGTLFVLHELLADVKHLFGVETQGVVMSDQARKTCSRALHASDRPIGEVAGILTIAAIRLVTSVSDAALAVDFYLKKENKKMLVEICVVAHNMRDYASMELATMQRYVDQPLRLRLAVASSTRHAV